MQKSNLLFVLLAFFSAIAKSQSPSSTSNLPDGYYSVVASFSSHHEDYAQIMVSKLGSTGRNAKYGFDPNRHYWYVYTYRSPDKEICRAETLKLQKEPAFSDAWIHAINQNKSQDEPKVVKEEAKIEVKEEPADQHSDSKEEEKREVVAEPADLKTAQVVFNLINSTTNEVVEGEVEVVEPEKAKLLVKVKGNENVSLPDPRNKTGRLTLISNSFGFRKEELEINFLNNAANKLKPYVKINGDKLEVDFSLVRIQKGDISTLYNVYFFNDAAIMLPTSQYQLNSLLKMLNEKPTMKIILHGHTNGGGGGKIIYMGPSKNFFAITKDVVNDTGSAKELSNARAKVIREWLLTQGIAPERIEVKGWGGAKMIYDKDSQHARKNIRVDVEVAED